MINVVQLIKFIKEERHSMLVINQVNESVGLFYLNLIERIAIKNNIKLNYEDNSLKNNSNDLFIKNDLDIFFSNNKKNIDRYIQSNQRCILFTDYKNFKIYSASSFSISGYEYQKDIAYYIKEVLKINNSEIVDFCKENPHLTFSEISKYLVNDLGYVKENKIREKNNFIIEIRKKLFNLKKEKKNSLEIYYNLKKEVQYKKFNFLTY